MSSSNSNVLDLVAGHFDQLAKALSSMSQALRARAGVRILHVLSISRISSIIYIYINTMYIGFSCIDTNTHIYTQSEASTSNMKRVRVKHEDEPKRPLSAYQLHNEKYFAMMKEKTNDSRGVFKLLAKHWNEDISDAEKAKFQKKARHAKEKYDKFMEEFRKSHPVEYKMVEEKVKKPKRDPNMPRRPMSSYNIYMKERRLVLAKKNKDMKATEIIAQIGKEWRSMGESAKDSYRKRAVEIKKQYEKDMKQYLDTQ